MELATYRRAPANVQEEIIAERKKQQKELVGAQVILAREFSVNTSHRTATATTRLPRCLFWSSLRSVAKAAATAYHHTAFHP